MNEAQSTVCTVHNTLIKIVDKLHNYINYMLIN